MNGLLLFMALFIVVEGDSLTAGNQSTLGKNYPNQLAWMYSDNRMMSITNVAVSGDQLIANIDGQAATQVDPTFDPRKGKNVLVIWAGTNDFVSGGKTDVQVFAALKSYCQARKAAAATALVTLKIVVLTTIGRGNFNGTTAGYAAAYNTAIRSEVSPPWDAIADVAADSRLQVPSNLTYFDADTIHLNNTGYGVVATIVKTAIDPLL